MLTIFAQLHRRFASWPDEVLSLALLASAVVIAIIALVPGHVMFKALVLAYVVFP